MSKAECRDCVEIGEIQPELWHKYLNFTLPAFIAASLGLGYLTVVLIYVMQPIDRANPILACFLFVASSSSLVFAVKPLHMITKGLRSIFVRKGTRIFLSIDDEGTLHIHKEDPSLDIPAPHPVIFNRAEPRIVSRLNYPVSLQIYLGGWPGNVKVHPVGSNASKNWKIKRVRERFGEIFQHLVIVSPRSADCDPDSSIITVPINNYTSTLRDLVVALNDHSSVPSILEGAKRTSKENVTVRMTS